MELLGTMSHKLHACTASRSCSVSAVLNAGGEASMTGIAAKSSGTHRRGGAALLMTRFMTAARARALAAAT